LLLKRYNIGGNPQGKDRQKLLPANYHLNKEDNPMKMDWLNYSRHVLKWLFAALSIFTIFSADYVDIPIGALIVCLYAPLLFEQDLVSNRVKWYSFLIMMVVTLPLLFITKIYQFSLTYPQTTALLFLLAVLIFTNSLIVHKEEREKAAK